MKKGFTLIELVVVFAIIGVLATIVIAFVSQPKNSAQAAAVKANLQAVKKQAEIYYINNSTNLNSYGSGIES